VDQQDLQKKADRLSCAGQRGWLTRFGIFFESEETPVVRIIGLELGDHERAALQWLETNRPDLLLLLENIRESKGYECWEDTDEKDVIKSFMFKHGFIRIAPDEWNDI